MAQAADVVALISKSVSRFVVTVSTRLSIAAVLGLGTLPLLPNDAASRLDAPTASAPIEIVKVVAAPPFESAPAGSTVEPVARRRWQRPQPPASAPAHRNSAITPAPEPLVQPAPDPKPDVAAPAGGAQPPAQQAATPETAKPDRRDEVEHNRKISAISSLEAPKAPVPPAAAKPDAASAEPAKPEAWSDAEVISALRECVRLLAPIAGEVEVSQPVRHQQCGTPAPVLLKRLGWGANRIEINPPAELNCAMVASLHAWVENTLQPAAREVLGTPIARLRNVSGYVCRARNGHPLGTDKLSEHALANAIDIAGFITPDGRTVDVARGWGLTERDKREAAKQAALRPAVKDDAKSNPSESKGEPKPSPAVQTDKKISLIAHKVEEPAKTRAEDPKSRSKTAALTPPSKGKSDATPEPKPALAGPDSDDPKKRAEAQFLRRLHKGACGVFGTVLGPEANDLHRDHFHLDLAPRRQSAYCQ